MRKIKWWSDAGTVGSSREGEIEVEDDAEDEEIQETIKDIVFNYFEWGWHPADEEESK